MLFERDFRTSVDLLAGCPVSSHFSSNDSKYDWLFFDEDRIEKSDELLACFFDQIEKQRLPLHNILPLQVSIALDISFADPVIVGIG